MNTQNYLQFLDCEGVPTQALPKWAEEPDWFLKCYHFMVLARQFDTKAIALQRTGQLGTYASLLGSEGIDVPVALSMQSDDVLVPYYRNHACQIIRGLPLEDAFLYWGGDERGNAAIEMGKDFPNAVPIATQSLHACGVATAMKINNLKQATVTFIGDGGTSKGDFMEALNIAGVWHLPVVFIINNNQWAISTHANLATGGRTFAERGLAYDIPSFRVDGNDFLALYSITKWARDRASAGMGPTHIEVYTYRAGAHSSSDDPSAYRPNDEASCWPGGDPIQRLKEHLMLIDEWDEEKHEALAQKIDDEVMAAYKEACEFGDLASGPYPPASTIFTEVYETVPWHIQEQREELGK